MTTCFLSPQVPSPQCAFVRFHVFIRAIRVMQVPDEPRVFFCHRRFHVRLRRVHPPAQWPQNRILFVASSRHCHRENKASHSFWAMVQDLLLLWKFGRWLFYVFCPSICGQFFEWGASHSILRAKENWMNLPWVFALFCSLTKAQDLLLLQPLTVRHLPLFILRTKFQMSRKS